MNIKMQSINLFSNNGLKSTQDRLDRQAKRDNQIAYFEQCVVKCYQGCI